MMFGPQLKSVMVVYPKAYYAVAIYLKHAISKYDSLDSTLWTIEQYQQNLPTLSGKSYVIFLGTEKDCPVAKPFHDNIESVTFHEGACYAVDGPKALVYGLDKFTLEGFAKRGPDKNYIGLDGVPISFAPIEADNEPEEPVKIEVGKAVAVRGIGISALASGVAVRAVNRAAEKAKGMWAASDQRVASTKTASTIFLDRTLCQWLGLDQGSNG